MFGRPATVALFALLTAIAVPWYWRPFFPEAAHRLVAGAPLCVVVSVVGSAGVSILAALVLAQPWDCESSSQDDV